MWRLGASHQLDDNVLRHISDWRQCSMQVCAVHMSLVSQLERLGGLEEWALYVALHLPDGPEEGSERNSLLLELLHRHAPVWAASQAKQEFITRALGLPAAWLASALATLAAYHGNPEGELQASHGQSGTYLKCDVWDRVCTCPPPRVSTRPFEAD